MKILRNIILGFAAGAAISLGGLLFVFCKAYIPNYGQYIGALCFPIGLILVCYLSLLLYTGKIGFYFHSTNKKETTLDLIFMLIGNIIGALICGLIMYGIFKNNTEIMNTLHATVEAKTKDLVGPIWFSAGGWVTLKGIGCGACVYLAVFCFKNFKSHILKLLGIYIPIFAFVALGLEHCIANVFYVSFNFDFTNGGIYLNFLYAMIGNSLGALVLDRLIEGIKKLITLNKKSN